jgi:ankyrin repeat protein
MGGKIPLQRVARYAFALTLLVACAGCARQPRENVNPETARRELALRGIDFKEAEFVRYAGEGDAWAVKLFLAAGMSPDVRGERGDRPLTAAIARSQKSVAKLLLERNADPNVLDRDGKTPLIRAAQAGDKELVRLLLDRRADVNMRSIDSFTPFAYALRHTDTEIAQTLLERGADVNATDDSGGTPLSWAVFYERTPLVEALLARGVDPNTTNKVGGTPLMIAAAELVNLLLKSGAKTDLKDKQGRTARQFALDSYHTEVAELLAEKK